MSYEYLRTTVESTAPGDPPVAVDKLLDGMSEEPVMLTVISKDTGKSEAIVTLTYFQVLIGKYKCRYAKDTFLWVKIVKEPEGARHG